MDPYTQERLAHESIAEAFHVAAHIRLAMKADGARPQARPATGLRPAELLRALAHLLRHGRSASESVVPVRNPE